MGSIYKRGNIWWIKWHRQGRPFYESSESTVHEDAKNLLKLREGDVARGVPVSPRMTKITIDELLEDVVVDYRVNGKKTLVDVQRRITKHLLPFFGGRRATQIETRDIRRFIDARQRAEASNAEINMELAALNRAYNLAMQDGKIFVRPHVPMLELHNVRTGFFEPAEIDAVCARLNPAIQPIVRFGYITGWRLSEVLTLEWRQVDFAANEVRLEPGSTKNGEGRTVAMTDELRALLKAQRAHTDAVQRARGAIVARVFHRNGKPIKSIYRGWLKACREAGHPGRLFHDLRRCAVRNLVRAGVSEKVAMETTGHKTRTIFERYHIVSNTDLHEAARRLNAVTGK